MATPSSFLSDLGRPTRRGVRRCPQCGTINGTRGLSCKNRLCDKVFKDIADQRSQRKINLDPSKLITEEHHPSDKDGGFSSSWTVTYSVKQKERGPDHVRGFVQVEYEDGSVGRNSQKAVGNLLLQQLEAAGGPGSGTAIRCTCFVDNCPKRGQTLALAGDDQNRLCLHVICCVRNQGEVQDSQPLTVKQSVLNALGISADWKQLIWLKARRNGPLVQRVSKSTMVVKCDKDENHPLGYLHTVFLGSDNRFGCSCLTSTNSSPCDSPIPKKRSLSSSSGMQLHQSNSPDIKLRCIHFYSCVAVFSSDQNGLAREFSRFISDEQVVSSMQQVIAILGSGNDSNQGIKVGVLSEDMDIFQQTGGAKDSQKPQDDLSAAFEIELESADGTTTQTISLPNLNADDLFGTLKRSKDFTVDSSNPAPEALCQQQPPHQVVSVAETESPKPKQPPTQDQNLLPKEEALTASDWLASVTERINLTMHYGYPTGGKPDPLIFQVPHAFINFLMDRISLNSRKKRLPNSTSTFSKFGTTYTKYTWLLTNVLQVKQVFDTPKESLNVTRRFIRLKDGSFKHDPKTQEEIVTSNNKKKIKQLEFKTFLKVGQMSSDPKDITPFQIDWTPDLLPKTKVGEMSIQFQYGHQRNGQLDLTAEDTE